jgi:DNA-binding NtrC family response regulator
MMRLQGHDVLTRSTVTDALMIMRMQSFDALVLDCAEDAVDILNFTAKAQGLQPSLAVFLASEWGDELASGLEEFTRVLSMLEDDELASIKTESLLA